MKIQNITRKSVNSFCRTCLAEIAKLSATKGQKFNIHLAPDVSKWFHACTSLKINKKDGHPKFLCQKCYSSVQRFYEFREMSIKSKQTLDSLLNNVTKDAGDHISASEELKDEIETYKTEKEGDDSETCKNDDWFEFEMDDKSLIAPLLISNFELEDFKKETESTDSNVAESKREALERKTDEEDQSVPSVDDTANFLDVEIKTNNEQDNINIDMSSPSFTQKIIKSSVKKDSCEKTLPKERLKFQCVQCSRRFLNQQNFDRHMRIHQGLKLFDCHECDRGFNKKSRLKEHIKSIHENHIDEEFPCTHEGCDKLFRKKESWRMHYRKKHTNYEETRQTYMCETCGSSFKNANSLKKHRFKHGPEEAYPFQCKQCDKRFLAKCKLQEHEMRHAGIKKFECPHCGMKKTTRNELRMHMNYHTKERQWNCPYCSRVFNSSGNMNRHVICVHKGERNYSCSYCKESFTKAESLKHHEMRHTGEKPHECEICGKRFIQRTALLTHLKTHEKNKRKFDKEATIEIGATISNGLCIS